MSDQSISLSGLKSHLKQAVNILRVPVDAADFKTPVFLLLIFNHIYDVHEEEYQMVHTGSGVDEEYARFPQNYGFQISAECHFSEYYPEMITIWRAIS